MSTMSFHHPPHQTGQPLVALVSRRGRASLPIPFSPPCLQLAMPPIQAYPLPPLQPQQPHPQQELELKHAPVAEAQQSAISPLQLVSASQPSQPPSQPSHPPFSSSPQPSHPPFSSSPPLPRPPSLPSPLALAAKSSSPLSSQQPFSALPCYRTALRIPHTLHHCGPATTSRSTLLALATSISQCPQIHAHSPFVPTHAMTPQNTPSHLFLYSVSRSASQTNPIRSCSHLPERILSTLDFSPIDAAPPPPLSSSMAHPRAQSLSSTMLKRDPAPPPIPPHPAALTQPSPGRNRSQYWAFPIQQPFSNKTNRGFPSSSRLPFPPKITSIFL